MMFWEGFGVGDNIFILYLWYIYHIFIVCCSMGEGRVGLWCCFFLLWGVVFREIFLYLCKLLCDVWI